MKDVVFIISMLLLFSQCGSQESKQETVNNKYAHNYSEKLQTKAGEALQFARQHGMNQDFCLLIDMEIHSGLNRFFVWDFTKKEATHSFLVSHGCGSGKWSGSDTKHSPKFSNVEGNHLSSLGKYRVGERGGSTWGVRTKYSLYGLEPTNRNAMKRAIVFHSWDAIPDTELYPEGWGCPAISNDNFRLVDNLLKTKSKSTLMWIYN